MTRMFLLGCLLICGCRSVPQQRTLSVEAHVVNDTFAPPRSDATIRLDVKW